MLSLMACIAGLCVAAITSSIVKQNDYSDCIQQAFSNMPALMPDEIRAVEGVQAGVVVHTRLQRICVISPQQATR